MVGDVDVIARVHVDSAARAERGLVPDAVVDAMDARSRGRMWQRIISDDEHPVSVLVGVDGDAVVGLAAHAAVPGIEGVAELHALYVDPARQGRGCGGALLAAAEADLRDRGFSEATAWVLAANTATRAFYEAHGWQDDDTVRSEVLHGAEVAERRYRKRLVAR